MPDKQSKRSPGTGGTRAGVRGAREKRRPVRPVNGYEEFLSRYPEYATTLALDELREREFARLDAQGHVYLDYTGGGLYAESLVRNHTAVLLRSVLGNPHSTNPTSFSTTRMIERCRRRVLEFFNASPDEYCVVFTANATHGLKIIGESYPFSPGDQFLLTFDNHNSVNGIREFDRARGATTRYVPVTPPDLRVPENILCRYLDSAKPGHHHLFAYPAQSNFSGVQHPLGWIELAQDRGWDVLLDAAAFVPTNRLDLGRWHPDYVVLSFYKMFGYPTGVGALIARLQALEKLRRPWFSGGTITVASVQADRYVMHHGGEAFEDGTLNYAILPAVDLGLDFLDSIGVGTIHARVICLAGWLIDKLLSLQHRNGLPVIRLYGPTNTENRGATITFNVYDSQGQFIDHTIVEARANERNISLRTGCFCNPGAGELALGLEREEIVSCFNEPGSRMSLEEFRQCIDGKSTGAVRISMGLATNFRDVRTVYDFIDGFRES
jgi:molybdenum cofactor sulfurtransferase